MNVYSKHTHSLFEDLPTFFFPVIYMYRFTMRSNVIQLFLDVLFLSDEGPDIEAVWDVVENVRPNCPDQLQISSPLWHGKAYKYG